MNREKELTIKLLTEKLEKLSNKKIILTEVKIIPIDSIDFNDNGNRDEIFTLSATRKDIQDFVDNKVKVVWESDKPFASYGVYQLSNGEYMYAYPDAEFFIKTPKGVVITT